MTVNGCLRACPASTPSSTAASTSPASISCRASRIYYVSAFDTLESSGLQGLIQLRRGEIRSRSPTLPVLDGLLSASEKAAPAGNPLGSKPT
jgi:hypothetical protein